MGWSRHVSVEVWVDGEKVKYESWINGIKSRRARGKCNRCGSKYCDV